MIRPSAPIRSLLTACVLIFSPAALAGPESGLERLGGMAGDWAVESELFLPNGETVQGAGRLQARAGPGGHSILMDFTATDGPMAGFELHQILAWNSADNTASLAWVDSARPGLTRLNGRAEGDRIVFYATDAAGAPAARSVIRDIQPNGFTIESLSPGAGGEASGDSAAPRVTMRLVYTRLED